MTIPEIIKQAHENAVEKGFYTDNNLRYCPECNCFLNCKEEYKEPSGYCDKFELRDKNIGELLMLIVSELGEALEAHRKSRFTNKEFLYNESVTHENGFQAFIKDTFEDELADAVIRICDMCGYLNIDLEKHIELKMKYNATREYKHGKKY